MMKDIRPIPCSCRDWPCIFLNMRKCLPGFLIIRLRFLSFILRRMVGPQSKIGETFPETELRLIEVSIEEAGIVFRVVWKGLMCGLYGIECELLLSTLSVCLS